MSETERGEWIRSCISRNLFRTNNDKKHQYNQRNDVISYHFCDKLIAISSSLKENKWRRAIAWRGSITLSLSASSSNLDRRESINTHTPHTNTILKRCTCDNAFNVPQLIWSLERIKKPPAHLNEVDELSARAYLNMQLFFISLICIMIPRNAGGEANKGRPGWFFLLKKNCVPLCLPPFPAMPLPKFPIYWTVLQYLMMVTFVMHFSCTIEAGTFC